VRAIVVVGFSYFSKLAHDFGLSASSSKADEVVVSVISLSSAVQEGWFQESVVVEVMVVSVMLFDDEFQSEEESCAGFVDAIEAHDPPALSNTEDDEEEGFCPEL
jgi:hypothetical protein